MIAILLLAGLLAHASPDIDTAYEDCVKAAQTDEDLVKCLDVASNATNAALGDVVRNLLALLNGNAADAQKANYLEQAHARWLPSRDADCQLQAAVTMDTPEDAAEAAKLCVYQANVPRLKQYRRFLEFLSQ